MSYLSSLLFGISVLIVAFSHTDGLFDWIFNTDSHVESPNDEHKDLVTSSGSHPVPVAVPFEMKTADENFLSQANFIKDLSPLDLCHHRVCRSSASLLAD